MSGAQHTPGPWTLEDDGEVWGAGCLVAAVFASGDFPCLDPDDAGASDGEGAANARLIAAAPEMLAALHLILADETVRGWPNSAVASAARAAIAKASAP